MLRSHVESPCTELINNKIKKTHIINFFSLYYCYYCGFLISPQFTLALCCSFVSSPSFRPPRPRTNVPLDGLLCLVCMVKVPTTAPMLLSLWKPARPNNPESPHRCCSRSRQPRSSASAAPYLTCKKGSLAPLSLPPPGLRSVTEGRLLFFEPILISFSKHTRTVTHTRKAAPAPLPPLCTPHTHLSVFPSLLIPASLLYLVPPPTPPVCCCGPPVTKAATPRSNNPH